MAGLKRTLVALALTLACSVGILEVSGRSVFPTLLPETLFGDRGVSALYDAYSYHHIVSALGASAGLMSGLVVTCLKTIFFLTTFALAVLVSVTVVVSVIKASEYNFEHVDLECQGGPKTGLGTEPNRTVGSKALMNVGLCKRILDSNVHPEVAQQIFVQLMVQHYQVFLLLIFQAYALVTRSAIQKKTWSDRVKTEPLDLPLVN